MTSLEIHFKNAGEVELRLCRNSIAVGTLAVWPREPQLVDKGGLDFHFDTVLVTSVDKILKKNKIESLALDRVLVTGTYEQSSVSFSVAQAVASALKIK